MEVVAAVFTDGERILACRRREHLQAGGRWEFPGGKLEADEAPGEALVREIAEELGVEIEVDGLLDSTTTIVDGTEITLSCYFVHPVAESPQFSTDHDELGWFERNRLVWLHWADPDLPAVRKLAFAGP
jgi:8-oxo-dGTP diphosphatase